MSGKRVGEMTDEEIRGLAGAGRPLTYDQASSGSRTIVDARERYEALTDRKMAAQTVALLRERGAFDAANPAHASLAECEPLAADDWLEMMAAGEVLARYYRHPAMLDHAAKAGANWEQIGAARGTSAERVRQDYREWADGQHDLLSWKDGRFGMPDDEYAAALQRAAEPAERGRRVMGMYVEDDGMWGDGQAVEVRFPVTCPELPKGLSAEERLTQLRVGREAWPWLTGEILGRRGPGEWEVVVYDERLAQLEDGSPAPAGTPPEDLLYPTCYRGASEIRESFAGPETALTGAPESLAGQVEAQQGTDREAGQ